MIVLFCVATKTLPKVKTFLNYFGMQINAILNLIICIIMFCKQMDLLSFVHKIYKTEYLQFA